MGLFPLVDHYFFSMKIHHLRNATLILETAQQVIIIDPALGAKGSIPPLSFFRAKRVERNPTVPLPDQADALLPKVTHCLITHLHPDHLDEAGTTWLRANNIPIYCSQHDAKKLKKKGLTIAQALDYHQKIDALGGTLEGIPAVHGYGLVAKLMGKVMGFHLALPEEPSVYISSDTVLTPTVQQVLREQRPDLVAVAAGGARLDILQPLLMRLDEVVDLVAQAPQQVLAHHLEALNHCPTTRAKLRAALQQRGLLHKVWIPEDGEANVFTKPTTT